MATSLKSRKYSHMLCLLGLMVACFVVRLWGIHRGYWSDELITLRTLNNTVLRNPFFFGYTTNLPLFFYAVRIWNVLFSPENVLLFRLLPVLFSLLTLWILFLFLTKYFSFTLGLIVSLFFVFSPLQIYYAQELRPYSLVQFFLVGQFVFLFKYLKDQNVRYLRCHTAFVLLALVTHYSAFFFYFSQMGLLLIYQLYGKKLDKKMLKSILVVSLFSGLIYFIMSSNPYFKSSVEDLELSSGFGFNQGLVKIKEVVAFYYWFGLKYYYVSPVIQSLFKKLMTIILAYSGYVAFRRKNLPVIWITGSLVVSLVSLLILESMGLYPFGGRHIMAFSPFLYIFVGYGMEQLLKKKRLFWILPIVMVSLFMFHQYVTTNCPMTKNANTPHQIIYRECLGSLGKSF